MPAKADRKRVNRMNEDVIDIVVKYGKEILCSEDFRGSFSQTHHFNSTVGDHTLGVTVEAVKICLRMGFTDEETLRNVVKACLCHDLGILGRDEKFSNNAQCLMRHPIDSVEKYKEVTGEENERILDSIVCHMFPLKLRIPKYKEGWILTLADKTASLKEKMGRSSVTEEDKEKILRASEKTRKPGKNEGRKDDC